MSQCDITKSDSKIERQNYFAENSSKSIRTFVKTGKWHYTDRHKDSRTGKDGREET